MHVDLYIDDTVSVKQGFDAFAKAVDSDQHAQSTQADHGRHVFAFSNFSACQRSILFHSSFERRTRKAMIV